MQCPRCQAENRPDRRFCADCGAALAIACPSCGFSNEPGEKFCGGCGQPLSTGGLTAEPKLASPRSYTPKHLAEKILTSRSALEGERKRVTVLFCDIANSTPLAESLGAERMHGLLGRFFELALGEVHRYEGTANQFLGDGLMALFGAPLAHEDHARRAVLAALGIQRALRERGAELELPPGQELSLRMGVNTGLVVVGKIGDNLRMDYTAVGDTTHLAARLQQLAEPGTILVSQVTSRQVRGYVNLESVGPPQVKGIAEPVPAHKVLGLGPRRSPLEGLGERPLAQFVGRQRELADLHELLAQVEGGQGQVAGIVGEPGVGKSRLLYELRQSLAGSRVTYLDGRCLSYGSNIPYLPVMDQFRNNCAIADTDSPEVMADKVRVALQEVGMDPDDGAPYLLHLLGLKAGAERIDVLTAEAIKARTFETLQQMSLRGSRRRPLILAIEDLHWIDNASEEYFASLVENLAGASILLLTTYRPG
jgi:class 3 adenylate cyclase